MQNPFVEKSLSAKFAQTQFYFQDAHAERRCKRDSRKSGTRARLPGKSAVNDDRVTVAPLIFSNGHGMLKN
jgi:hypothetical protein